MKTDRIYLYIRVLSLLGIFLAVYLLWEQLFHPSFQPCRINSTINCDAIISGAVSKTLGLPTPLYGLTGYTIIFFSTIFYKKKLLLSMALFGLAFCLWIAYRELFQLRVICPVCIGCQLIMITVFILAAILNKNNKK